MFQEGMAVEAWGGQDLVDSGGWEDCEAVAVNEAGGEGSDEALLDRAALHPAHVEGRLVRECIKVQQFQRDGGGELFRGLEESNKQRGLDEIFDEATGDARADEELMSRHAVVGGESFLVPVEVKHRIQDACHGEPVLQRQALEISKSGENLTKGRRKLRERAAAENRCCGFKSIRTVKR